MTSNNWLIAIIIIAVSGTIVSIYLGTKSTDDTTINTDNVNIPSPKHISPINPTPFKTGYIKNSPQSNANLCGGARYPVKQPYVDYGPSTSCCGCDNLKFNSSP